MVVVVVLEARFDRTPDGKIWTVTMFPYTFWTRYLEVFDTVRVIARVRDVAQPPAGAVRSDGERVAFHAVPYYVGPWQYIQRATAVKQAARAGVRPGDAVILRISCNLACCLEPALRRARHPFAVEMVADPYDGFSPGSIDHPLRPFFRWLFTRAARRQCQAACAAAYVTRSALQRRYPPAANAYATHFSDVVLPQPSAEQPAPGPRVSFPRGKRMRLITVGALEHLYKAPDVLIQAVARCVALGLDIELVLVGDGKQRPLLESDVRARGLAERIRFLGMLPAGDCVRRELDEADLFVLPSRQEGLPRAMIEAMAQGLPCIGSTVGGIPELLPAEDMVPPNDVEALAHKISEIVQDPERMQRMSQLNVALTEEYREETLGNRRREFYRTVRRMTEERFGMREDRPAGETAARGEA